MPPDERIPLLAELARHQHGVFTLAQAIGAGHSRATIRRRLERGIWCELAPRVYRATVSGDPDWGSMTMACALAVGGAACRTSALARHGLHRPPPTPQVVVARTHRTSTRAPSPSSD